MNVIFAGTPEFAAKALAAIIAAGHHVPLVLTQPDRPAHRGMVAQMSAVKKFALEHGLAVAQPPSLRENGKYPLEAAEIQARLRALGADVMVVAAYGLILPQSILGCAKGGCINIHASLLPRWRGAAPIQRAIEAGDGQTGITIMQMDAGLDTGPMLRQETMEILPEDTSGTLLLRLAEQGARLIVAELQARGHQAPRFTEQPQSGITYAQKISKEEAQLDFTQDAEVLARRIRAFNPAPGTTTRFGQTIIKVWHAHALVAQPNAAPGVVTSVGSDGLCVACGTGILSVTELQRPGAKRMAWSDFSKGFVIPQGALLQ